MPSSSMRDAAQRARRGLWVVGLAIGLLALTSADAGAAYRDVIAATPNLAAQWRFGEAGGTTAYDSTATQDGTYAGTPVLGAADALANDGNPAITIDSAGDRFSAPANPAYGNAGTVEFWVKLLSYGDTTQYRAMVSKGYDVSQRNWLVALGNNATGQLTYGFGSGGAAIGRRSSATLSLNTWHLVDLVHPTGKIQLYLDGALDSELATAATPVVGTDPVIVGDDGQTGAVANATYDELSLYGRALTATEIAARYAAGTAPTAICAKVASPSGSDTNAGTAASPYKSSSKLVSALTTGQTGCLRTGTYVNNKLTLATASTTLQTYPGDASATLSGAVWLKAGHVTVQELKLDATTTTETTSPTLNGVGDVVRYDDISNSNTKICVHPSDWSGLRATAFVVERNRIHNCGRTGNQNTDHGIYIAGDGGIVRNNAIFDNGDRGVQIYPNGTGNLITHNTIDNNGEGILFGGDATSASSGNTASANIISNSNKRWLVESSYPGPAPATVNVVTGTCLYATNSLSGGYYSTNGGVEPGATAFFTISGSILGDPLYVNRAGKDFRLTAASGCHGLGAAGDVAQP